MKGIFELIKKALKHIKFKEGVQPENVLYEPMKTLPDDEIGWYGTMVVVMEDGRVINDAFYDPRNKRFFTLLNDEDLQCEYIDTEKIKFWSFIKEISEE